MDILQSSFRQLVAKNDILRKALKNQNRDLAKSFSLKENQG
jgi:hypothetical protein